MRKRLRSGNQPQPMLPFSLNGFIFPRDVGRLILHTGLKDCKDPIEHEILLILWRTVCKTWHAMLEVALLKQLDRNKRLLFELYEEYECYNDAASYFVSLGYSLKYMTRDFGYHGRKLYHGTSIRAAEADDVDALRAMIPLEPRLKPLDIWETAIRNDSLATLEFMIPVILFHHGTMADSLRRALYTANTYETVEIILSAFPLPKKIPLPSVYYVISDASSDKWFDIIDLFHEKFDGRVITTWLINISIENRNLVRDLLLHVGEVDRRMCQHLKRNSPWIHNRVSSICECEPNQK